MDSWTQARRRRERRRRIIGGVVAIIAALALIVVTVAPSFASPRGFTRYDATATAHANGTIDVVLDLEYDFGTARRHGIYLTYLTRQPIEDDPEHYRVYDYRRIRAESPTAPANVRTERSGDGLGIYIGDESKYVSGTHSYRVSFTLEGMVNVDAGGSGRDEIYWNIIGTAFDDPIENITITVTGPDDVREVGCWHGGFGSSAVCAVTHTGDQAHLTHDRLSPGAGLTIAVAYDGGTFPGVTPLLTKRATWGNTMGEQTTAALAGVGALLAAVGTPILVGIRRRDDQYLDLPPGQVPARGMEPRVGRAPRNVEIPVQFTPPAGLNPADVGMVLEGRFRPAFITATIVDLAVRGYVHITSVGTKPRKSNWELTRIESAEEGLTDFERRLLDAIFDRSLTVELDELGRAGQNRIARVAARQKSRPKGEGWFDRDPGTLIGMYVGIGAVVFALGAGLTALLTVWGVGLLGIPVAIAGIALMLSSGRARKRTALGRAHYVQALGFKKYLETAEGNQLRFEAGEDIFSRYLPYAIVYGVVDEWLATFQHLAERGEWHMSTPWYTGHVVGATLFTNPSEQRAFSSNLSATQGMAALSGVAIATSGSSGGSAFSSSGSFSGGGFSGGGGGGGGGGSW